MLKFLPFVWSLLQQGMGGWTAPGCDLSARLQRVSVSRVMVPAVQRVRKGSAEGEQNLRTKGLG